MTDSAKLDLLLTEMQNMDSKIQSMDSKIQSMDSRIQSMDSKIQSMDSRIDSLESQMKQTERTLRNEIRKECGLVLDEVERVHKILDKHKSDKTMHTA